MKSNNPWLPLVLLILFQPILKQGKSEGFDSGDRPSYFKLGFKSSIFSAHVTLKFDGWPWKKGQFFYIMSSFVHHFKSIGEFKLELLSRHAKFGPKLTIFCPVWTWNLMGDLAKQLGTSSILHQALCIISNPLMLSNLSYSPEMLNLGQNWRFFCPSWPWNSMDDLEKQ